MPKFKKIAALVPKGEHFDESAIVNEGGWVTVNHLTAIEAALEVSETTVSELATANGTVETLNTEIAGLNTAATASQLTISTQAAKITELEGKITVLGAARSGAGTPIIGNIDNISTENKPVFKSEGMKADSPLNKAVAEFVALNAKK